MFRFAISCLALTLTAPSLFAEARLAAPNATAPTEAVNWTAGVNYTYDASGNVTVIGKDNFRYDETGRLVQAEVNGVTRVYTYDAFGNRTGCSPEPNTGSASDCQLGLSIDPESNRVQGVAYDRVGNVESYYGHTYSYDALNMPVRDDRGPGGAREFVYSADDERIAIHTVGSNWSWTIRDVTGKVLREFTSDQLGVFTLARDYVHRDGLLLASVQPSNNTTVIHHYHVDHLGTPRRVTDHNNRIVGFHDYFAFGPEVSGGLTEPNPASLQYTGHERDKWGAEGLDTLDYMHARYYSLAMGRFLSVDPVLDLESALRAPQAWNRYSYVRNNPLNATDPTGMYMCQGTEQDCATIEARLEDVRKAAQNLHPDHEGRAVLDSIVKFFGDANTETHVIVDVNGDNPLGATSTTNGVTTIRTKLAETLYADRPWVDVGVETAGVMAHEGQHGLSQKSDGLPPGFARSVAREEKGYMAQAYTNMGLGRASAHGLWTPWSGFSSDAFIRSVMRSVFSYCEQRGANCQ